MRGIHEEGVINLGRAVVLIVRATSRFDGRRCGCSSTADKTLGNRIIPTSDEGCIGQGINRVRYRLVATFRAVVFGRAISNVDGCTTAQVTVRINCIILKLHVELNGACIALIGVQPVVARECGDAVTEVHRTTPHFEGIVSIVPIGHKLSHSVSTNPVEGV